MTLRTFNNKTPQISSSVFIDKTAVLIGDIVIDDDSSVWPLVVIRGDIHHIHIGKRSNIQDGTIIHVTHAGEFNPKGFPVKIGDGVIVGHQAVLHGCTIEDECLIGIGAKILDGAIVKKHVIVGAGSVVPPGKVLESGYVWVGTPVKKARKLTDKELAFFSYSADYYVKLAKQHKAAD